MRSSFRAKLFKAETRGEVFQIAGPLANEHQAVLCGPAPSTVWVARFH